MEPCDERSRGFLARILLRLLGEDSDWVLGDLEERGRRRPGVAGWTRRLRDIVSVLGWAIRRDGGLLDGLGRDLRHTLAALGRDPGFTAMVVLTLALGIGANTAVFSVVDGVLLRPLPYADADRLVMLWTSIPERGIEEATSAYANIADWRARSRTLEDLATFDGTTRTLTGGAWPERVSTADVSANLFSLLGVEPELGRAFTADEEGLATPVAVVSHELWVRRFGGSAGSGGRSLEVEGRPLEIVGVMPEAFAYPDAGTEIWIPWTVLSGWEGRAGQRGRDSWRVLARLAPGASLEAARAEMADIAARLERDHPGENAGLGVRVAPLRDQLTGASVELALWTLFGAVGLVLLIAGANAAHLMVARGVRRADEYALRMALGAGASRLVRLTLIETVVLALVSGVLGLVLARTAVDAIVALAPAGIPRLEAVGMRLPALLYGLALAMVAGIAFGVGPAVARARRALHTGLRGCRGSSGGRRGRRARGVLVVAQLALAMVLVFGANLLIRSFLRARDVDLGLDPRGVLMANLSVASPDDRVAVYRRIVEGVGALPGVTEASVVEDLFIGGVPTHSITVEGAAAVEPVPEELRIDAVDGPFFRMLHVPILRGRHFTAADDEGAVPVAIVNETMAGRLWPGEEAVGKRFHTESPAWIEVVGVVPDMRRQGFERAPVAQAFRPYAQAPSRNMNLLVRTDGPVPGLADALRATVAEIDRSVPVYGVTTVRAALDRYLVARRFQTTLLGLFSAVALLLAAIGVYGLVQYSVQQRTREVGLRIAVGARPAAVVAMVLGEGLALAVIGLALGLVAALGLSKAVAPLLFEVTASDPLSVVVTSTVLLVSALAAGYLPARRAAGVDPAEALRGQ